MGRWGGQAGQGASPYSAPQTSAPQPPILIFLEVFFLLFSIFPLSSKTQIKCVMDEWAEATPPPSIYRQLDLGRTEVRGLFLHMPQYYPAEYPPCPRMHTYCIGMKWPISNSLRPQHIQTITLQHHVANPLAASSVQTPNAHRETHFKANM